MRTATVQDIFRIPPIPAMSDLVTLSGQPLNTIQPLMRSFATEITGRRAHTSVSCAEAARRASVSGVVSVRFEWSGRKDLIAEA